MLSERLVMELKVERDRHRQIVEALGSILALYESPAAPTNGKTSKPVKVTPPPAGKAKEPPVSVDPKEFITEGRARNYMERMQLDGRHMSIRPIEGGWEVRQS